MEKKINRRNFISTSALAGAGFSLPISASGEAPSFLQRKDDRKVNIGVIGLGERGTGLTDLLLRRDDCNVVALCDIHAPSLKRAKDKVIKAGQKVPKTFGDGEEAFRQMLELSEVDAVLIATPWTWHIPMAVAAMRAGKFAATEVCGATDIQECWDLVNAYEETGVPCMFLENVCYRRDVMAILNMVRMNSSCFFEKN